MTISSEALYPNDILEVHDHFLGALYPNDILDTKGPWHRDRDNSLLEVPSLI